MLKATAGNAGPGTSGQGALTGGLHGKGSEYFGARGSDSIGCVQHEQAVTVVPVDVCESSISVYGRCSWVVAINSRETEQATCTGCWHSAGLLV